MHETLEYELRRDALHVVCSAAGARGGARTESRAPPSRDLSRLLAFDRVPRRCRLVLVVGFRARRDARRRRARARASPRSSASDACSCGPSELLAYESDGLPGYQQQPSLAVFPGTRDETIAVVRAARRARRAVRAARRRHRALRRRARRRRRAARPPPAHARSSRSTRRTARAVVEPGVVNAALDARRRAVRAALRARSVEPGRVHDRRQRRRERGRAALPQVRRHAQSRRSRVTVAAARRRDRHARQRRRRDATATTCSARSSAPRAASASRSTSRCGSTPQPAGGAHAARRLHVGRRRGARGVGDHRVGHRAGGARDDGRADDPAPSRRRSTPPAIRPTPRRCC